MSIIKILWRTFVLFICSIIQLIGVLVDGIAKIFTEVAEWLEVIYNRILAWKPERKKKKTNIHVPL